MIRRAKADDAGSIAAIWNHVIRDTSQTFTTAAKDPVALAVQIVDQPCFVAEGAGAVLGFVIYGQFRNGPGYAHTMEHSIHVAEAARAAGVEGAPRALASRLLRVQSVRHARTHCPPPAAPQLRQHGL